MELAMPSELSSLVRTGSVVVRSREGSCYKGSLVVRSEPCRKLLVPTAATSPTLYVGTARDGSVAIRFPETSLEQPETSPAQLVPYIPVLRILLAGLRYVKS